MQIDFSFLDGEYESSREIIEVVRAVHKWWRYKRPLRWSIIEHCDNPTINCMTEEEKNLAKRFVTLLKWGERSAS